MQDGWVVPNISHLTFGGKENTLSFSTRVWLVALTHYEVVLSLSPLFSQVGVVLCALAKAFALSAIIWLGVIGCKTHVLLSHLKVYTLVRPSC